MKASDLDSLFRVLRKHRVAAFEQGPLKVSFHPLAFTEGVPGASRKRGKAQAEAEAETQQDERLLPGDDPDLIWSAE